MQKNKKSSSSPKTNVQQKNKTPRKREYNIAYIDAQNLYLWTRSEWRQIDYDRFRIYLRDKFKVQEAYYFIWYDNEKEQALYEKLKQAWFVVVFREHNKQMTWKKKWNVDVDICFEMMKKLSDWSIYDSIVLVTGDWDYIKPVKYLIEKKKFKKILFPNKKYSSLYRQLQDRYSVNLSVPDIKAKIVFKKEEEHEKTTDKNTKKVDTKTSVYTWRQKSKKKKSRKETHKQKTKQ